VFVIILEGRFSNRRFKPSLLRQANLADQLSKP